MLDLSTIIKYDPSGMHKIYDKWPEIAKQSYESNKDAVDFKNIDHIVFAGMGGSGTIGDIISSILSKSNIHTCIVKGYHLPNTVDKNTLVVTTNISGNTSETLAVLKSALKLDCKIAAFSAGGRMQQFCTKNKVTYKKLDFFHSPRASLAGFLYSILSFLGPVFNIKKNDITESISTLEDLQRQINSSNLKNNNNPSLKLAEWISGIALVIIGSIIGYQFLDAYLYKQVVFLGSLFASVILFLLGAILCVTAIILFSMATLMRERE
ncbi:MAG: hypothetical protein WEC35_03455 [Nitrosopumilaceae archaeon]